MVHRQFAIKKVRGAHGGIKPGVRRAKRANPRITAKGFQARGAGDGRRVNKINSPIGCHATRMFFNYAATQPPPAASRTPMFCAADLGFPAVTPGLMPSWLRALQFDYLSPSRLGLFTSPLLRGDDDVVLAVIQAQPVSGFGHH